MSKDLLKKPVGGRYSFCYKVLFPAKAIVCWIKSILHSNLRNLKLNRILSVIFPNILLLFKKIYLYYTYA